MLIQPQILFLFLFYLFFFAWACFCLCILCCLYFVWLRTFENFLIDLTFDLVRLFDRNHIIRIFMYIFPKQLFTRCSTFLPYAGYLLLVDVGSFRWFCLFLSNQAVLLWRLLNRSRNCFLSIKVQWRPQIRSLAAEENMCRFFD